MKHAFPREDVVDVAVKSPYQEPNTELSVGWVAPKKRNPNIFSRFVALFNCLETLTLWFRYTNVICMCFWHVIWYVYLCAMRSTSQSLSFSCSHLIFTIFSILSIAGISDPKSTPGTMHFKQERKDHPLALNDVAPCRSEVALQNRHTNNQRG